MSEPVTPSTLSSQAIAVLEMIAAGHSYEQIIQAYPGLTYRDIFAAASEALALGESGRAERIAEIRRRYPRAYEKWTTEEEEQLCTLIAEGRTIASIAGQLKRQAGAIHSRLVKLGLTEMPAVAEQSRPSLQEDCG